MYPNELDTLIDKINKGELNINTLDFETKTAVLSRSFERSIAPSADKPAG